MSDAATTERDNPAICIKVHNDGGIPSDILDAGRDLTGRIYHGAGLEIVWGHDDESGGQCIALRIVAQALIHTSSEAVMGAAVWRGREKIAYVFYPRVATGARRDGLPLSAMLGYVMAHEIGHLLLPLNAHSRKGVMRGVWDAEQIRRARLGELTFTQEEVRIMTQRMAANSLAAQLAHQP